MVEFEKELNGLLEKELSIEEFREEIYILSESSAHALYLEMITDEEYEKRMALLDSVQKKIVNKSTVLKVNREDIKQMDI